MYQTIRKHFCWPGIALNCYQAAKVCPSCERKRIRLQSSSTALKLLTLSRPLEHVAIDHLGQLWPTSRGHNQFLVIVDSFIKMVREIPIKTVTAFDVAKAFTQHWAFVYGFSETFLTDNGKQFCAKFLQQVY
eukprot:IDg10328t1